LSELTKTPVDPSAELQLYKQRVSDLERVVQHFSETKKLQKALFQIVDLANSSQTLEAFYKALHDIVKELIPAKNFFIILHHADSSNVSFPYYVDEDDDEQDENDPLHNPNSLILTEKLLGSPTMKVIQTGKLLHLSKQEMLKMSLVGKAPEDWIGVPLILEGKLLGALVVQSYESGFSYHKKDEEFLIYVSQHIASGLRRQQDAESLKRSTS